MKILKITSLLLSLCFFPKFAGACPSDGCDGKWHGDAPHHWHGQGYGGCRNPRRSLPTNYSQLEGAQVFEDKGCLSCHTIGGGDLVGPDLRGLFARRKEKWVRNFIQDPNKFIGKNTEANVLQNRYGPEMPNLKLSQEELDQLIAFLKEATK